VGNLSWPQVAHGFLAPGFRFAGIIQQNLGSGVIKLGMRASLRRWSGSVAEASRSQSSRMPLRGISSEDAYATPQRLKRSSFSPQVNQ
jgi:hypothetical protein